MADRLRIFVTTSHISTVYITLHAASTRMPGDTDILFVDDGYRQAQLLALINAASKVHDWALFHSFSQPLNQSHDFRPSLRNRITRRWKSTPGIRLVYSQLLKRFLHKKNARYRQRINQLIAPYFRTDHVQLFMMTQTYINTPLIEIFPKAELHFMEHGIGDYYYIQHQQATTNHFHVIFSTSFARFLVNKGLHSVAVSEISGLSEFSSLARKLLIEYEQRAVAVFPILPDRPFVFILLEAVDMYNVTSEFWSAYMNHIVKQLPDADTYHYLLKPHPIQSQESLEHTLAWFNQNKFSHTLLGGEALSCISAEVAFQRWSHQTKHVFCLFSSACFYLSQLYSEQGITFWYSTSFMSKHISKAPPQYKTHYNGLVPLIEEVFSERCTAY